MSIDDKNEQNDIKTYSLRMDRQRDDLKKDDKDIFDKLIHDIYLIGGDSLSNKLILRNESFTVQIINLNDKFINVKKLTQLMNINDKITHVWNEHTDKSLCFSVLYDKPIIKKPTKKRHVEKRRYRTIDATLFKSIASFELNFLEGKKMEQSIKDDLQNKFITDKKAIKCIKNTIYRLMKNFSFLLKNTKYNITSVHDTHFVFECKNIGDNVMADKVYHEFMLLGNRVFRDVSINCATNSIRFKINHGTQLEIKSKTEKRKRISLNNDDDHKSKREKK